MQEQGKRVKPLIDKAVLVFVWSMGDWFPVGKKPSLHHFLDANMETTFTVDWDGHTLFLSEGEPAPLGYKPLTGGD